ncbi:hypothetical protein K1719_034085 [Acacia pycnantha]|nr:hypothetical protein K1719_034085 [Acacia pycnantha]
MIIRQNGMTFQENKCFIESLFPTNVLNRGYNLCRKVPLLGQIVINQSLTSIKNMAANDAGNSDSSNSSSSPQSPVGKKGRGPTQLKGLAARRVGGLVRIVFDDDLNPTGPEEDRFVSYIGYLSKTHVGLKFSNWREVDEKTRGMIWAQLLQTFTVPDNEEAKKHFLGQVHVRWKDFKHTLTRDYIFGDKKNEDPCVCYTSISKEEWTSFARDQCV